MSSPILNPMMDVSGMDMFLLVEKAKTMPRRVGERKPTNIKSPLAKLG